MECLAVSTLPDGPEWLYQVKLDGYRAMAVKSSGKLNLFSRRRNSFNSQHSLVFDALADLPDNIVIDGEVVALNDSGRPDFNLLQHHRAQASRIHYFVFDLLTYDNHDLTRLPLIERHEIMESVLKLKSPRVRIVDHFEGLPPICSVQFAPKGWKVSLLREGTVGTRLGKGAGRGPSTG